MSAVLQLRDSAGFPEIVRSQAQCRLCLMARSEELSVRTAVRIVHDMYSKGISGRALLDHTDDMLQEAGSKFDTRSIMRHLANHVDITLMTTAVPPAARDKSPDPRDDFESDYFEMRSLYQELKPLIRASRTKTDEVDAAGFALGLDADKTKLQLRLFDSARQILKAMSDMRKDERLTTTILERHTEAFSFMIAEALFNKLQVVREHLNRGDTVEDALTEFSTSLEELFTSTAETAIERSRREYRL